MNEVAPQLVAAVALSTRDLSTHELAVFNLGLNWNDGKSRTHVQDKPWFPKVEGLFTEKSEGEGKTCLEVCEDVREAVAQLALQRIKSEQ